MFDWLRKLLGMDKPTFLQGDERFGFAAEIDGSDIVVRNAQCTWFGGADDPEDNGETASGISTIKRPNIQACALPMNFGPCVGSPIPKLPWGTKVEVTHDGKTITVPVIDLGPSRGTGHAIDLTVTAFEEFAERSVGKIAVDYRILGAARFVNA